MNGPKFQIVETENGVHARWCGGNNEPVWITEVYEVKEDGQTLAQAHAHAEHAIDLLQGAFDFETQVGYQSVGPEVERKRLPLPVENVIE